MAPSTSKKPWQAEKRSSPMFHRHPLSLHPFNLRLGAISVSNEKPWRAKTGLSLFILLTQKPHSGASPPHTSAPGEGATASPRPSLRHWFKWEMHQHQVVHLLTTKLNFNRKIAMIPQPSTMQQCKNYSSISSKREDKRAINQKVWNQSPRPPPIKDLPH